MEEIWTSRALYEEYKEWTELLAARYMAAYDRDPFASHEKISKAVWRSQTLMDFWGTINDLIEQNNVS